MSFHLFTEEGWEGREDTLSRSAWPWGGRERLGTSSTGPVKEGAVGSVALTKTYPSPTISQHSLGPWSVLPHNVNEMLFCVSRLNIVYFIAEVELYFSEGV